jgi:hypothetical protein
LFSNEQVIKKINVKIKTERLLNTHNGFDAKIEMFLKCVIGFKKKN